MKSQKQLFLKRVNVSTVQDALRNSLVASLQRNPTYKDGVQNADREPLRSAIQRRLKQIESVYSETVSDELHIQNIVEFSNSLSKEFGNLLIGGRFRIGTSQKALNLFAKFLWCLNDYWPAPPHCPLDGTILKQVSIYGSWTKLDSCRIYREWIDRIRKHAHSKKFKSIADWELNMWNENG